MASNKAQFEPARAKLWIASVDVPALEVRAQYNPKELAIDKKLKWTDRAETDNRPPDQQHNSSDQNDLDFDGVGKRTMSIELFFDGFETGRSVQLDVDKLELLSSVFNPHVQAEHERRAHQCLVGLGAGFNAMRPFICVIESLNTKYTMWDTNGKLLRATCTVALKEAHRLVRGRPPRLNYGVKTRSRF
jgi:hypothetical protein